MCCWLVGWAGGIRVWILSAVGTETKYGSIYALCSWLIGFAQSSELVSAVVSSHVVNCQTVWHIANLILSVLYSIKRGISCCFVYKQL